MCPPPGERAEGGVYFGGSKCCTYWPQLGPHLVGRILGDGAPDLAAAREEIRRQVAARCGVTPLGLLGPGWFWALYHQGGVDVFGRADRLRCPFFDAGSGRCGVWRHRESTCATWFCKLRRGAVGLALWDALGQLLRHLERSLANHCALAVGLEEEALAASRAEVAQRTVDGHDADGGADPEQYARRWGGWAGRELAYYQACAEVAGALSPQDVLALGGAEGAAMAAVARRRFASLMDGAPPAGPLRPGRREVLPPGRGTARLVTYRAWDPLEVPAALLPALDRFDGRPTGEVVREIGERDGLAIDPELLRLLVDFEVLVPVGPRAS